MGIIQKILDIKDSGGAGGRSFRERTPFYLRATLVLLGLFLFFNALLILRDVLVPLCFAALIAILLNPLVNRLMKWKVPKVIAIILALLLAVLLIGGIIAFISAQVAHFSELAPELKEKSTELANTVQSWVRRTFNVPISKQNAMIAQAAENSKQYVGQTLGTLFGIIGVVVLLPIYTFLFLYYKPLFLNFFYEVFEDKHEEKVADVLSETKGAIQGYIVGLLIETAIIAVLNSVALLILGVKYAVLIGVIGAVLNLIPYVGGLIAILLPVIMSFLTGDGGYTTPLLIVAAYSVIQFLDNNIIVPKIVSSKVDVNAFVTIIIVLLGGTIWGVSGMFLAVPFIAVCKIVFDRVPGLKPWGKLLGTDLGEPNPPRKVVSKIDEQAMDADRKTD